MNMATADLYGTMDPFQRTSISPKRRGTGNDLNSDDMTPSDYQVRVSLTLFSFFRLFFLNYKTKTGYEKKLFLSIYSP